MIYRMIRVCAEGLDLTVMLMADGYTKSDHTQLAHYPLQAGEGLAAPRARSARAFELTCFVKRLTNRY